VLFMLALEGIRVLDLSRLAPGPYCSMLLADLGADVLLVEEPADAGGLAGQAGRRLLERDVSERAMAFNALSRNKRSIALNLKNEAARQVFYKLAERADVVLEGFRPGVVKRLGVDYETLGRINPRIVYCSLSGYGQSGPYAGLVGHDINYISIGGALGMIGWPGTPPAIPMNIIADFAGGGLYAAFAILAAIIARERTGRGQYVDMAMTDGVLSLLALVASQYFGSGVAPRPGESLLNGGVPFYCVYETRDGRWLSIGCLEPGFWEALCRAVGREDFIPYQMNADKYPEMFDYFRQEFKTRTRDEWFEYLRQFDICVGPVYSLEEVFNDPQVQARDMVVELEHPAVGKVQQVGIGAKLSQTPGSVRSLAPGRGQHTEEVLLDLGYSRQQIEALQAEGAVG
jgi:crotonobetainyl-CoA:carnitine CoA-transferase CaiB-like acyl-CoA transferase